MDKKPATVTLTKKEFMDAMAEASAKLLEDSKEKAPESGFMIVLIGALFTAAVSNMLFGEHNDNKEEN